jgi:hypothetical protein
MPVKSPELPAAKVDHDPGGSRRVVRIIDIIESAEPIGVAVEDVIAEPSHHAVVAAAGEDHRAALDQQGEDIVRGCVSVSQAASKSDRATPSIP